MKIFNLLKLRIQLHILLATLAIVSIISAPRAQQPAQSPDDRIALYQALLDLQNPWTVMCVAAHPDDEDGTSLIVMRRKFGAHTVSLFSTFGEGGQNAIGPELYEELGAIRARETMAAAEIQGSEPHFLGLKDFGYSKTRDEAFKFWGHEEALRRMVLEIRKLRPDVIITHHSTTSNDHGQHQATALMVVEAFDAAADPNKFPEQLKDGVTTWQVQRLFVRMRGNAQQNPDRQGGGEQVVTIDPNEKDPVRGVVYAEEALRALQQHATQGPWPKTFAEYATRFRAFSGQQGGAPGQLPMIRYVLVKSAKDAVHMPAQESHNFLDGLHLPDQVALEVAVPTLRGPLLDLSAKREEALAQLVEGFRRGSYGHPVARQADPARRERMKERVDSAMALAAGVHLQVQTSKMSVVPGSIVNVSIRDSNGANLRDCSSSISSAPGVTSTNGSLRIPTNTPINIPLAQHLYEPTALSLEINTRCTAEASGARFTVGHTTSLDVAPKIEVNAPQIFVTTGQSTVHAFTVQLTNNGSETFSGRIVPRIIAPCESIACKEAAFEQSQQLLRLIGKSVTLLPTESMKVQMSIPLASLIGREQQSAPMNRSYKLTFAATSRSSESIAESAPIVVAYADARVSTNLKVGYIRGFDFSLPNALNALGAESKELSVDEVKADDLSKYTSVIVDNRVYESKPELIAVNQKLLDYANAGGTLIVFYHKSDEWNPDARRNRPQLVPYKLIVGNERVTDENAPITFIEPDHPLLNSPNKLGQDDFKDWIQERGLYYPREWDPQFHALLQSNDPGEAPLKGGLLVADYGRGHYIYTSMVWYRQLRAGVPGGYRMLANMISYGRN